MNCANCQYNDGMIYTSIPPQYKCTITGKFHFGIDRCDVEFKPVKHGRWIIQSERWYCSECGMKAFKYPYCPYCGADMREEVKVFTDKELKTYQDAIDRKSIPTSVNIMNIMDEVEE